MTKRKIKNITDLIFKLLGSIGEISDLWRTKQDKLAAKKSRKDAMKIHDHGRNRLLTALKTLLLCFGYWMRSGLDVLVGLRGGNMLTSAETLDTFEKL